MTERAVATYTFAPAASATIARAGMGGHLWSDD
ncbi:MAG: hypothetical protein QOF81_485, partial [Acidimicrobiaceae bacterium]|nr:hypothetical protein [Acidimicrobiaceae bacterium]